MILPFCNFNNIKYDIYKIGYSVDTIAEEEDAQIMQESLVGEIVHLFNGFAEYTSKNDKYGISLPEGTEEDKCLILYATLLIDYLLF